MQKFRELRKEMGITQEELITKFNQKYGKTYTASAISQFENGRRIPETQALIHFAEFFNVSLDYLLGRSEQARSTISPINLPTQINFSEDEHNMIEHYRQLPPEGQRIVRENLESTYRALA